MLKTTPIVISMILYSSICTASSKQQTSLSSHVHGASELTLMMEGKSLEIEFSSPAMNLVGFEHKAVSKQDILSVNSADEKLRQAATLFSLNGTKCKTTKVTSDIQELLARSNHSSPNEHEHEHEHEQNSSHSEIVSRYYYQCDTARPLDTLEVGLFKSFPAIQQVKVLWLVNNKQGTATLNKTSRPIKI